MTELRAGDLLVRLDVNDAKTAQDAGARFAHALADIGSADFMVALAEQQDVIQRAITDAGFSTEQAWLVAEHFGDAARSEWGRVASTASAGGAA